MHTTGIVVRINHGDGLQTVLPHLSGVNVRVGLWVNKDYSLLGWTGATGDVTGPHLHRAVRVQGREEGVDISTLRGVSRRPALLTSGGEIAHVNFA